MIEPRNILDKKKSADRCLIAIRHRFNIKIKMIYFLLLKYSSVTFNCFFKISFHKCPLTSPVPLETLVLFTSPSSICFMKYL